MKQSEAAGQAGALTLAMLQASYAAIVRIGRRFEAVCPAEGNTDNTVTALGKLEDLYEQCVSELEDAKAGLDECRENGFQDDLAYGELMVTKLGHHAADQAVRHRHRLCRARSGAVPVPAENGHTGRMSRCHISRERKGDPPT
ncbi:MAG: hypothetical protein ACLR1P_07315 [Oscillospiraceae bacterium]